MGLLLLSLGLSLVCAQKFDPRAIVQQNYNMARVSGVWYLISMASSDLKRIEKDGDLRVFIRNIQYLQNGSLMFDFRFVVQGACEEVVVVCEKTDRNGEFSISYEGKNKVTVLETDYWNYITFYLQNIKNKTETRVLALFETCKKYKLDSQNIIEMSRQDPCYARR
ncbi:epididymal-specific lipocalin-9 [Carlito syrichta]|uniref:Epididymal-specific lipocalin-9 n=1 Tax=Carlito syrichta TaxID=1868482 RepID=A0A1U7UJH4_CARSF|nr:epididymal-specific lipocalin-9 [Carlito syrichta]